MLRVIVRQARPGMTLARSISNPRQADQTLLQTGFVLDASTIARLHELGVYDFWITYPGLDFLDNVFSREMTQQQQRLCETFKTGLQDLSQQNTNRLPLHEYREIIQELILSILACAGKPSFMSVLSGIDDALLRHSTEVCILSVMLGLRLEGYLIEQRKRVNARHAREVSNLGLGCLLHDIGELQLPEADRESRRPWSLEVDDGGNSVWRKHTELGHAIVRHQLEPSAATIVLNHHQAFDGSGFPQNTSLSTAQEGSQIHIFSRIAAASDLYHHIVRRQGVAQPAVRALWEIQQPTLRSRLDPRVLEALLSVVTPFMPGMVVTLSDRTNAVITRVHDETPCYPEVQLLDDQDLMSPRNLKENRTVVDLREQEKLCVAHVDGFPVENFLFGPRRTTAPADSATASSPKAA